MNRTEQLRLSAEREAEPFARLILRVRQFERPSYLLRDGRLELLDDGLDPASREIVAKCKAAISDIHARAFAMIQLRPHESNASHIRQPAKVRHE